MSLEIVLAVASALLCITIILFKPYFGLMLFTILLYLRPADFFPALAPLHVTRLVAGLTFLVVIFRRANVKEPFFKNCSQVRFLTILVFMMILSIITSIWKSNSIEGIINFLKTYSSFFLIVYLVHSVKRLKNIIWIMVLSALVLAVCSVANYFQGINLVGPGGRIRAIVGGMFRNPNDLALCLLMLLPFIYFLFSRSRSIFTKSLLGASLIIYLLGFTFTKSRGGLVGLIVMFVFIFLRSRNKIKIALGLPVLIFLFTSFAPTTYMERISEMPESHRVDPAVISRIDAWKAGILMMSQRPFGVGVGNFGEAFVKYRYADAIDLPGVRRAAHNAFIQIGGETGILGLIVFLLLISSTLKSLTKTKKLAGRFQIKDAKDIALLSDATYLSLMGFIACALFLSQAYNWILYYLIGFSVVLNEFVKRQNDGQTR